MPTIISANRLQDGTVVYLGENGQWVEALAAAGLHATKAEGSAALTQAERSVAANIIVDPILVEVVETPSGYRAATLRDKIRATGPTITYASRNASAPR